MRRGGRWVLRAVGLVLLVAAMWLAREPLWAALPGWMESVRDAGLLGMAGFVALYVAFTVLALPGSVLTAAAGALWGVGPGLAVSSPASVLGATAAWALARTVARPWVERRLGEDPRIARVDQAVARRGLAAVILLRLSPLLPFNVLNYALGLTGVRWTHYVLGSFLGMLPGTLLYVWLGSAAEEIGQLAQGEGQHARVALLVLGLVATLALAVGAARLARRALDEEGGGP